MRKKLSETCGNRCCPQNATAVAKAIESPAATAKSTSSTLPTFRCSRRAERKRMFMQNFFKKPIRCMYSSLSPVGLSTERSLCSLR